MQQLDSPVAAAPASGATTSFLQQRGFQMLLAALLIHIAAFYSFRRPEPPVNARPLAEFPAQIEGWGKVSEHPVEDEVQAVLRADDTLNRTYGSTTAPIQAGFFVAFFKSQQAGQAPHSPKNCLPGSGWEPLRSTIIPIKVDGRAEPIEVNRYIIARGDNKAMVLYWYQSHGRVVASEYWSKVYLVLDSIRLHRSDTALVRIVIPVEGSNEQAAEDTAKDFARTSFSRLATILPS
jgi:EpsI family protein